MKGHSWKGHWIRAELPSDPEYGMPPAPLFRGVFFCRKAPQNVRIFLSGLGWHELFLNGTKADDRVLAPAVMQFDRHVPYIEYDVSPLAHPGKNIVEVILGNGWYYPFTEDVWHFQHAPWCPEAWEAVKLRCDVSVGGRCVLSSDRSWKCRATPIRFNSLRGGEFYDARREREPVEWRCAEPATPPPGLLLREEQEPCRVLDRFEPVSARLLRPGVRLFDFGRNLTGWARIRVRGKAGATVVLRYGERIRDDGSPDREHIAKFVLSGEFQTDRYTLSGAAEPEVWSPRFTYHGFRYVEAGITGEAELESIVAEFIGSGFERVGRIETDSVDLNRIQQATVQSYHANFTGIPTDCPHREKNGWTGDAQLAMETGLWNFNGRAAYRHFLQIVADTQKPSGMISSIAPTSGWGYQANPPWDAVLFEIPFRLRQFYGDNGTISRHFPVLERYWRFAESIAFDDVLRCGLGDWCSSVENGRELRHFISSAYFCWMTRKMAEFAPLAGRRKSVAERYRERAGRIAGALLREFRHADGGWCDGSLTALSVALHFGLSPEPETDALRLAELVRERKHRACFGIFGAKFTPRVLAEHGFIDDALELFLQPDYPGWGFWFRQGAVTLCENWKGNSSRNHIMFGDVSAWMYEYLAGFKPGLALIAPQFPSKLNRVRAEYKSPHGLFVSSWRRLPGGNTVKIKIEIPEAVPFKPLLRLPDGSELPLPGGVTTCSFSAASGQGTD